MSRNMANLEARLEEQRQQMHKRLREVEMLLQTVRDLPASVRKGRREKVEEYLAELQGEKARLEETANDTLRKVAAIQELKAEDGVLVQSAAEDLLSRLQREAEESRRKAKNLGVRCALIEQVAEQLEYSRSCCPVCKGTGQETFTTRIYDGEARTTGPCYHCTPD